MSRVAYPISSSIGGVPQAEEQQRQRTATTSEALARGRDRSLDRLRSSAAAQHRHSHTPSSASLAGTRTQDHCASSATLSRPPTFAQLPATDADLRVASLASNATTDDGFLAERWRHRHTVLKVKVILCLFTYVSLSVY